MTNTRPSGSEPPKRRLAVRQSRGTVTVPHGRQHGPNVRHRSIQPIRNRTGSKRRGKATLKENMESAGQLVKNVKKRVSATQLTRLTANQFKC